MIPTTVTSSNASPATPTSGGNSNSSSNSSNNNMQQNSTSTLMFGIASLILEGRAIAEDEYMQPQHHHHQHNHQHQEQQQHQHQQHLQHQQQQQQQYAHQLLTLSGNNNRNLVVASASQHHQQHYQQQQTPKPSTSRAAASLIYNANNASTSPLSVVASTSNASTSSSSISNLGHVINITTNPQAFYHHHHPQHNLHYAAAGNIDSSSGNSAASSSSSSSVALADCTRQRLSQKLCQLRQSSPTVSLGAIETQRASSVETELVTLALDLPIDELEVGYGTHHRHVMPMAVTTGGGGGGGAMSPGGLGSENFLHSLQSLATTCLRGSPPSEHTTSPGYRYPISMCASPVSPPVLAGTSPKYNSYRATPPPRYPSPYTLDIPGSGSSNGSGIQSPGVGWFSSPTGGSCSNTTGSNSGVDNGSGNARHAFEMRTLRRMQNPSTNSSLNKCNTSNAFSSPAANTTAADTTMTTTTTTTTKTKSGTTYPQQGPHCDQFLRKMGLAKGEAADTEDHICDMSYVNITCSRWRAHCLKMEAIMARCEPICIEVYLGPVAHKILLEQWIIIQKEKVPPPTMTLPSLCSAIRSQLYFSQISAWCDLIKKSDKTIYDTGRLIFPTPTGAAGDLATPNASAAATTAIGSGGNIGNTTAGNITSVTGGVVGVGPTGSQATTTTTITPLNGGGCVQQQQQAQRRPRLHIFYRIKQYDSTACFNSKPNVHNFPNVNITENCSLSVCLKSLPRINGGIPKIGVAMPTTSTTTTTSSGTVSAASALASTAIANVEREMATNGTTTTTTTTTTSATPETITTTATSSSSSNGHSLSLSDTPRTSRTTTSSSDENPSDSLVQINCDNNNKTKTTTATRATVIYANANANVAVAAKPTTTGETASSSSSAAAAAAVAVINNLNTAINANNNASTSKTTITTIISSPSSSTATPTTTTTSFTFGTAANGVNLDDVAGHNKCKFFIDEDELQDADFACDDDDSISDSTSISGSGCGGGAALDNSNSSCSTNYANAGISSLSHREKQLLKYRKRMLKRDKKHQRKPLNSSTAVEASCQLQQQRRREHNNNNNNNNNSKKSNGHVQPMEQSEEETCIVPRRQQRQPQHIEMISTGTQTSTNMAACCQQCGNEKSWICLKCSNILSSKHLDDDDMDSTSSISSNISCEIIQTPRNNAELLLQAIQRTPKVAAAKHKKKAAATTVADVVNNANIGSATQNNNQQLNLVSGSSSSALSTVLPPGCQVCKRQKTQHNFTPRSSESNQSNSHGNGSSKMDQKTLDVVVDGGSETKAVERITNEDDDDEGDGSGDGRAGVNGNVNGSSCSNGIDEFDKNEDDVDAHLMEGCEQPDETPLQAAHPAAEHESFITSTKLTPHIERCHLTGRDLRSRTPPNTEQATNALLLLNCDNAPQFKTPTTLASSSPGSLYHQQQQSKLITTKSPSQKPLQKPSALQITCHYATTDSSDANSATPPSPQQQQHTTLLMRKGLPKVNLTPIFCNPAASASSSSTSVSAAAAAVAPHTFSFDGTLHSSASAPAVVVSDTANNIPVQKSYSAPTLPNSPSLSPRFAKQAAIYKRRSRHLSDRSDRSSLGSDEQFSDEDLENGMFSPATSPMKQRTRIAAAFGRLPLLGNMEEALLQKRIMPKVEVMGFKVLLGASGGFCPTQLTIPASAYFYELHGDTLSTPYLCEIRLPRKGYSVPRAGTVQATLLNPMGTVVRMFVIPYDMRDMPPLHQTFIRQRILAEASTHETISMQTTTTTTPTLTTGTTRATPAASQIGDNKQSQQQQQVTNGFGDDGSGDATKHTMQTNNSSGGANNNITHLVNGGTPSNNNNSNNRSNNYNNNSHNSNNNNNNNNNKYRLSPSGGLHGESNLGHFISAEHMKRLRYSIHLRFQTSRSGRLSLHTDIRLLISRRTDCDTAAAHAKGALEAPNDLVTDTVMPSNPRYSARQETPSSNSNGGSSSSSSGNTNNNNNTTNINSNNIGGTSSNSSSSGINNNINNNNSNNNNCNSKI